MSLKRGLLFFTALALLTFARLTSEGTDLRS